MELLVGLAAVWAVLSVVVSLALGLLIRRREPADAFTRAAEPTPRALAQTPRRAAGTGGGVVVELRR